MKHVELVAALWLVACSKPESPAGAQSEPIAPPASATASAVPAASAENEPRSKEHGITPDDRFGTLPPGVGVAKGERAPDFTLKDVTGQDVRLSALLEKGPVLLVFYRGGWCPFCNFQVRALAGAHDQFAKLGVTPVLVSVDRVSEAAKTSASWKIPFPVLSDPELAAHEAYRVVHQVEAAELARLKGFGMDLEAHSGKTHHKIGVPAVFLVDREGLVSFAHADRDYKLRPSTAQLLAMVRRTLAT